MTSFSVFLLSSVLLLCCTLSINGQINVVQNRITTKKPVDAVEKPTTRTTIGPGIGIRNNSIASPVTNVNESGDRVRIVGGEETAEHEFPFIVSLANKQGSHFCGATIIHKEWILTAAHCIDGTDFQVKAGEHNIDNKEGTEQLVLPIQAIVHHKYNMSTFENDIALVRITPSFLFDGNVKASSLPRRSYVASGSAVAAGWGTTSEGSQLTSSVLRKVKVPIVDDFECGKQYGSNFHLKTMLCAGAPEGNKDSCQGDSGGPLICSHMVEVLGVAALQNATNLCGVVSYGYGCGRKGFAGVYTKVSAFMDWMEEHMYGKEYINANNDRRTTSKSVPLSTPKGPGKPIKGNKKSSTNNIHTPSTIVLLFHIITICLMYSLTEFILLKF